MGASEDDVCHLGKSDRDLILDISLNWCSCWWVDLEWFSGSGKEHMLRRKFQVLGFEVMEFVEHQRMMFVI